MKANRLVRDLAALAGGEGIGKVAGFVAFAWLARALPAESYGAVELAASMTLFFGLVVDLGLGPIGAREIARAPGRAPELAAHIPAARLLLALVALPAMILAAQLLGQPARTLQLVTLFALSLLLAPFSQRWLFQGMDRMLPVSGGQALRMVVFAAGAVLLVRDAGQLMRVGWIEIGAAGVPAAWFLFWQRRLLGRLGLSFRMGALRQLAREALPVGTAQIVWALNQYLPTMLVAGLVGGADIAWFGGAHRIVLSLGTFVWIYHFNLYPTLARRIGRSRSSVGALVGPSMHVTAWCGIGVALALSWLAGPLVQLAFGSGFGAAAAPLATLAWVLPLALLSGHARFGLIAAGHQQKELLAQALGVVVTLAVAAPAIPAFGPLGAALAMVASNAMVWGVAHHFARQHVGPLPLLGPVWRPALLAALLVLAAHALLPAGHALRAALGLALFLGSAPLVDRTLLSNLRRLAGAKEPQPLPVLPAAPGEGKP